MVKFICFFQIILDDMLCENLNSKQNPKLNAPYFERYILDPKRFKKGHDNVFSFH